MAWNFGAIATDGLRCKIFTCTCTNADANTTNTFDFTTNLMTDLDATPDELEVIQTGATADHHATPIITAANAQGVTVGCRQASGAATYTFRVTARVTRGIMA